MTEHEKLMLKRHLEQAIRSYIELADIYRDISQHDGKFKWSEAVCDAQLMLDKLNSGLL